MRIYVCLGKGFGETFEDAYWSEIIQMQSMWICICWGKRFEEAFESSLWWKAVQMQPMWLCFCLVKKFEETYDKKSLCLKTKEMQSMRFFGLAIKGDTERKRHKKNIKQLHPKSLNFSPDMLFENTLILQYIIQGKSLLYYQFNLQCGNMTM